jgi:hypothetical protein
MTEIINMEIIIIVKLNMVKLTIVKAYTTKGTIVN